jgi:hypothetical protein
LPAALVPKKENDAIAHAEELRAHGVVGLRSEISHARRRTTGGVDEHAVDVVVAWLLVVVGPRDDGPFRGHGDRRATRAAEVADARMGERDHLAGTGCGGAKLDLIDKRARRRPSPRIRGIFEAAHGRIDVPQREKPLTVFDGSHPLRLLGRRGARAECGVRGSRHRARRVGCEEPGRYAAVDQPSGGRRDAQREHDRERTHTRGSALRTSLRVELRQMRDVERLRGLLARSE